MSRSSRLAPLAVGGVAAACAALVLVLNAGQPLRVAAGLVLVLAAPGTALGLALWPRGTLGGPERTAVSVALGLALAALTTLALHAAGIRLDAGPWAVALGGEALIAAVVATLRRPIPLPPRKGHARGAIPRRRLVLVAAAAASVAGAGLVTAVSASKQRDSSRFSQLWALPGATRGMVRLGVRNEEGSAQRYLVTATRPGAPNQTWSDIVLGNGRTWTTSWSSGAGHGKLRVELRRKDAAAPVYRFAEATPP